jgi:hypothetical protein
MYFFSPNNYCYRQPGLPVNVKAYPIDAPVYVNGENINTPPYKALNYHPDGARPAVYVPVSQFSKVGATVQWDEQTQSIYVSTDYMLEDKLMALKAWRMAYGEISKAVETPEQQVKMRFNGVVDGRYVFDGIWWYPIGDYSTAGAALTVGRYYSADTEGAAGTQYLTVINDQGGESVFRRSTISFSAEGTPVPYFD